jgi:hypothetical protein
VVHAQESALIAAKKVEEEHIQSSGGPEATIGRIGIDREAHRNTASITHESHAKGGEDTLANFHTAHERSTLDMNILGVESLAELNTSSTGVLVNDVVEDVDSFTNFLEVYLLFSRQSLLQWNERNSLRIGNVDLELLVSLGLVFWAKNGIGLLSFVTRLSATFFHIQIYVDGKGIAIFLLGEPAVG